MELCLRSHADGPLLLMCLQSSLDPLAPGTRVQTLEQEIAKLKDKMSRQNGDMESRLTGDADDTFACIKELHYDLLAIRKFKTERKLSIRPDAERSTSVKMSEASETVRSFDLDLARSLDVTPTMGHRRGSSRRLSTVLDSARAVDSARVVNGAMGGVLSSLGLNFSSVGSVGSSSGYQCESSGDPSSSRRESRAHSMWGSRSGLALPSEEVALASAEAVSERSDETMREPSILVEPPREVTRTSLIESARI